VYEGSIDVPENANTDVYYKYVIERSEGREEWEERGNRTLPKGSTARELSPVFFSDLDTAGLSSDVNVTFVVDTGDLHLDGSPIDGLGLVGGRAPLSWSPGEAIPMSRRTQIGDWAVTVTFPKGTSPDVPFKFVFRLGGEWLWESTPGHRNHLVLLDSATGQMEVRLQIGDSGTRLHGVSTAGLLDDYSAVIQSLGNHGSASEYSYYEAMACLDEGRMDDAAVAYTRFHDSHPGGVEIDDYHAVRAHRLAAAGDVEAALVTLQSAAAATPDPARRALLKYAEGEVLLNNRRPIEARDVFRGVMSDGDPDSDAATYARHGFVLSFFSAGDPDATQAGIETLEAWLDEGPPGRVEFPAVQLGPEETLRLRWSLATAYEDVGNRGGALQAYRTLERSEQGRRKGTAFLGLVRLLIKQEQTDEALDLVEERLAGPNDGLREADLLLLKGRALHVAGREEEARTVFSLLAGTYPDTAAGREAEARANQ
jgi:tetratricopeptide (TPR) repeat protein